MAFNNYTMHTPRFTDATPGLLSPAFVKQQRHLFFFLRFYVQNFSFSLLIFKILFRAKAFTKGPLTLTTAGQGEPPVEAITL